MLGLQGQNPQRPCHSPEPQSWGRCRGSPLRRRIPVPSAWFPLTQGWLWWWGSLSWGMVNFGIYTWINEEWALVTRNSRTDETPRKHKGNASEKPEEFSAIKHLLWFRWLFWVARGSRTPDCTAAQASWYCSPCHTCWDTGRV